MAPKRKRGPVAWPWLERVVSGGQVGPDRLALEVAAELGVPTGGVAPPAFRTQRGPDPGLRAFGLVEGGGTGPAAYIRRSTANVDAAAATLAIALRRSAGTDKTISYCLTHGWPRAAPGWAVPDAGWATPHAAHRPVFVVLRLEGAAEAARAWLASERPAVLNVCGNRDGGIPEYEEEVRTFLRAVLAAPSL